MILSGTVRAQESFVNVDGYIYTKNYIDVKFLFQGKFSDVQDFVVVLRGGELNDRIETWTHQQKFEINDSGVFFLNDFSSVISLPEKNIYHSAIGFIKLKSNNIEKLSGYQVLTNSILFEKIDDLTKSQTKQFFHNFTNKEKQNDNCLNINFIPFSYSDHSLNEINYSLFASMTSAPSFLESFEFTFDYDNLILGDNIVQEGIFNVTLSNELLNNYNYNLEVLDLTENSCAIRLTRISGEAIKLQLFEKQLLNSALNLPNNESLYAIIQALQNVRLKAKFKSSSSGPTFNQRCIEFSSEFFEDCNLQISSVYAEIDPGFTSVYTAAGVEDESLSNVPSIITIKGQGFGVPLNSNNIKPFFNHVSFYDVDNGSIDPFNQNNSINFFRAGELEYISWTDKEIKMRVPTVSKNAVNYLSNGASTGKVMISTMNCTGQICTEFSPNQIYVRFAMFNDVWQKRVTWEPCFGAPPFDNYMRGGKRRNLVDINFNGGYNLFIGELYSDPVDNAKAIEQIEKALDVWRCEYFINVEIVNDRSIADGVIESFDFDDDCNITSPTSSVTAMAAPSESFNCDEISDIDSPLLDFSIFVNKDVLDGTCEISNPNNPSVPITYEFNIDETAPTNARFTKRYWDMQRVMIHELGHVFQLRHTNNPQDDDIMLSGSLHQTYNLFMRDLSVNDDLGAEHIRFLSDFGACSFSPMVDYQCSTTTSTNIVNSNLNVEIFPNPTTKIIHIKSEEKLSKAEIYNSLGNMVGVFNFNSYQDIYSINIGSKFSEGIYVLKLFDAENNFQSFKICVVNEI